MALLAVVALTVAGSCGSHTVKVDARWPGWGFTHTQYSADHGENHAVAMVEGALAGQPLVQNQHIMGWGANNPEPEPGVYNFASLDRRMEFIRTSRGIPVITLCCAPDWMKGGAPGETDWDRLTEAPLPEHFADFAELSATIARRYPDVRHFMVWNEFKGFFDDEKNRWDAEAYTNLYNQVYAAVKAVNPDNQVGGPYLDMVGPPDGMPGSATLRGPWGSVDQRVLDAFTYWFRHKRGADFVVIDGHANVHEGDDEFVALQKFSAVTRWVREHTGKPVWWAEWYVEPSDADWSSEKQVAVRTAALIEMAKSDIVAAPYWNPPPGDNDCAVCLWSDTDSEEGGRPGPFLAVLQKFAKWFPPGTCLKEVPAPEGLRVLAQEDMLLVVNTLDSPMTVSMDGQELTLAAYETQWIPRQAP